MMPGLSILRRSLILNLMAVAAACGTPLVAREAGPTPEVTRSGAAADLVTPSARPSPTTSAAAAATRAVISPVPLDGSLPLVIWQAQEDQHVLVPVHPLTGEPLAGYHPILLGYGFSTAFSQDGRTLAVVAFADEDPSQGGEVLLVDLATWQSRATGIEIDDYPAVFQFAPDGRSVLIVEARLGPDNLRRVDIASGQNLARTEMSFLPRSLAVTPDGAHLMVYGTQGEADSGLNPTAQAARLDYATLQIEWSQVLGEVLDGQYLPEGVALKEALDQSIWYGPGYAWAPNSTQLYLVHADDDRLTTVDFAAETVATLTIAAEQSWLDRLMALTAGVAEAKLMNGTIKQAALSPDGQRL
jgi:hypothetical protein